MTGNRVAPAILIAMMLSSIVSDSLGAVSDASHHLLTEACFTMNRDENDDIKTMKLYTHVERIKNELSDRGMLHSEFIDPIALNDIDSMHYLGNSAVECAILALKLESSSRVLDIGSGFGGTARFLSGTSNCTTTALELQRDIHGMGKYLTKKCRLDKNVKHECGDILTIDLDQLGGGISSYDGVISFLAFLHIPDKANLLKKCASMLKTGGTLFVEDFYCRSPFSEDETKSLAENVYAFDLPTREDYTSQLEASGFHNIHFVEKSLEWTTYVNERVTNFVSNRRRFEDVHGEPTYLSLLHFYEAVAKLFSGQNLGGVRIIATKKR
jgi:cyclopropane fatty-acyl-phospholipid synthase-like methyltransferase